MAGQRTPDDEPGAVPAPEDDSGTSAAPDTPWSAPPPPPADWGPVQSPFPTPWAATPHPPYAPSEYVTQDDSQPEPPETHGWSTQSTGDPWHIAPQPPWDPTVESAPASPPPAIPPSPPPQPPAGQRSPVGPPHPRFAADDQGTSGNSTADLPPAATGPRSTPRPPVGPPRVGKTIGFDEPWRTEQVGRRHRPVLARPILIALAALGVAALVAGGLFALTRSGGSKKPSGPAAQLADRFFTADPTSKTDGRDQELLNVAAAGSTVVALGGEFDTAYRSEFFVSTDGGRSFRLADVHTPDGQEPPYGDVPRRIAGTTGSWVALGSSPDGTVVWTSRDGKSWTRQPDDAGSSFNRPDRVGAIVHTRAGFVAVGDTSAKGDYSDASPVVWSSPDGRHWSRQSADQLGISVKEGALSFIDAAAVGDTVLAHGWNTTGEGQPTDLTWRSTDGGRSWESVSVPRPKNASGLGITATPTSFIAVRNVAGTTGSGKKKHPEFSGIVLSSSDAKQWSQIGSIHLPGYYGLRRISGSDRGLAALVDTGKKLSVVRSTDGRSWSTAGEVAMPEGRDVQDVAVTAGTTIVVGRDSTTDGNDALLQVTDSQGHNVPTDLYRVPGGEQPDRSVSALLSGQGLTLAVGSADGDGAIWTSGDGANWSRAKAAAGVLARTGRQRLLSVTQHAGGWLAVGYDGLTPKRPLVVTSSDGMTWQSADSGDAFRTSGDAQLLTSATAVGPAGFVIVGADGPSAAVWFSPDLKSWTRGTDTGHADLDGRPNGPRWMTDIVGGSYGYVAVGGLNDPTAGTTPNGRPAVWTSSDGRTWHLQQLPLPSGSREATFARVAANGNRIVAIGTASTASDSTVFAYGSSDGGKTWQQLQLPGTDTSIGMALTAFTETSAGFVAAAGAGRGGRSDVYLWTSADGRTWTLERPQGFGLSGRGDQWLTALTSHGHDLLAAGVTADHRGERLTIWRRPLP